MFDVLLGDNIWRFSLIIFEKINRRLLTVVSGSPLLFGLQFSVSRELSWVSPQLELRKRAKINRDSTASMQSYKSAPIAGASKVCKIGRSLSLELQNCVKICRSPSLELQRSDKIRRPLSLELQKCQYVSKIRRSLSLQLQSVVKRISPYRWRFPGPLPSRVNNGKISVKISQIGYVARQYRMR